VITKCIKEGKFPSKVVRRCLRPGRRVCFFIDSHDGVLPLEDCDANINEKDENGLNGILHTMQSLLDYDHMETVYGATVTPEKAAEVCFILTF
jgi:hypothetical protein